MIFTLSFAVIFPCFELRRSLEIAQSIRTDPKAILKWTKQYEYNGVKAFIKLYTNYSTQFKLDVLNFMIENGASFPDEKEINETAKIITNK